MALKRSKKDISLKISPYIWAYVTLLKEYGVPIQRAYLFGSWAKGTEHKWSDIDLAVVSPKFTSWKRRHHWLYKPMNSDLSIVEPHGFHPKDFVPENPVVDEILKYGIRIV